MATTLIAAFAAAVAGLLAGLLLAGRGKSKLQEEIQTLQNEKSGTEARLHAYMQQHETEVNLLNRQLEAQKADAENHLKEYKADVEQRYNTAVENNRQHYEQLMQEQERRHIADTAALEQRFNNTVKMVKEQMENATSEMLKRRQEEFTKSSSSNFEGIVNPLKETIDKMKKAMDENSTEQKLMKESVKSNLENMIRQSEAAQRSAEELTRAFKHETKTQGNWGEVILSNLLSSQGFTEGKDFETQATMKDADGRVILSDDGNRMIPDVVLHLDEGRDVIIDSKVSMTAYINYANATDELMQRQYLKEHIASIKKHVDELAAKDYTHYQTRSRIDFVIMFVPQVQALWAATAEEPSLWQDAMQKKVFIADEHTLYAALRIIRITWTHIDQERNHQKLYELAQEMIDRTGRFLKEYDSVGRNLQEAFNAYDASKKKLMTGGMSIGTTAGKILALGLSNLKASKGKKGVDSIIPSEYLAGDSPTLPTEEE